MTTIEPNSRARSRSLSPGLVEAAGVIAILAVYIALVAPRLGESLLDRHSFRQTQTAFTARIYHEQGIDLLHPLLPVLGEPFEVPFEFPLFQAAASLVMDVGVEEDRAMRTTGLACFLLTALLLFGLVRHVAGRIAALAAMAALVLTPFSLLWGRASLIEYLATAGAVGFTWGTILWRERGRPLPAALALVAGLVGMLVKPTTAVFWILPALAYRPTTPSETVDRRRVRIGTGILVVVPFVLALLWTRHADAIKAASLTTTWLTSDALREWTFGTIGQRFELRGWDVVLSRIGLTLLGGAGIILLGAAVAYTVSTSQRRFWGAMWATAIAPMLVFTNLYFEHDYYLAAISPALAALVGLGARFVWSRIPRRPAFAAGAAVVAVFLAYTTLDLGRSYWLRMHGAEDEPTVLPLAHQIARHTSEDDRVALAIDDWSPAILYYADRWGHMVVGETQDVAFDLIYANDYRYLVARDDADLESLARWPYIGALDRNLYAIADSREELAGARFSTTDDSRASPAIADAGSRPVRCGMPFVVVSGGEPGTWIEFAPPDPLARLRVSDDLAPLPVRRFVWVGAGLARNGEIRLECTGVGSLDVLGVRGGSSP